MLEWIRKIFGSAKPGKITLRVKTETGEYYEEAVPVDQVEQRMAELRAKFNPRKPIEEITFVWCLVGNIIDINFRGNPKELKHGTKHFSPGTKVYCFPHQWHDDYDNIKVIGIQRRSKKYICIVMPSRFITSWRLEKVYNPWLIKRLFVEKGWTDSDADRERILEMCQWLPKKTLKLNE
jgi:hypothetical protein